MCRRKDRHLQRYATRSQAVQALSPSRRGPRQTRSHAYRFQNRRCTFHKTAGWDLLSERNCILCVFLDYPVRTTLIHITASTLTVCIVDGTVLIYTSVCMFL